MKMQRRYYLVVYRFRKMANAIILLLCRKQLEQNVTCTTDGNDGQLGLHTHKNKSGTGKNFFLIRIQGVLKRTIRKNPISVDSIHTYLHRSKNNCYYY